MSPEEMTPPHTPVDVAGLEDFDKPEEPASAHLVKDPVLEAAQATWRGLPLSYSIPAKAAAFRYGMNLMGTTEDDYYSNGAYPGMSDDAAIVVLCSLCSASAGLEENCPKHLKNLLKPRTLKLKAPQLASALMAFFEGFQVDPMDADLYDVGFGLIIGETESEPIPNKGQGKPQGEPAPADLASPTRPPGGST